MTQFGTTPNANIQWTDGQGPGAMACIGPRFDSWLPSTEDVGTTENDLATGAPWLWVYRTDYTVSFSMSALPSSLLLAAQRLIRWLKSGGTITVNTGDVFQNSYTCRLKAKGKAEIRFGNKQRIDYVLSLELANVDAGALQCEYVAQAGALYRLTIAPSSLLLFGDVNPVMLTATVVDGTGAVVPMPVAWVSSDPGVASVDSQGNVTTHSPGTATVTASAGGLTAQATVTVAVNTVADRVALSLASVDFSTAAYVGTPQVGVSGVPAQTLRAVVRNAQSIILPYTLGQLRWTSSNPAAIPVTDNNDGSATVGPPTASDTSAQITVTVVAYPAVTQAIQATVPTAAMVAIVPSQSSVSLTAPGQRATVTFKTIDALGVEVP